MSETMEHRKPGTPEEKDALAETIAVTMVEFNELIVPPQRQAWRDYAVARWENGEGPGFSGTEYSSSVNYSAAMQKAENVRAKYAAKRAQREVTRSAGMEAA